MDGTYIVKALLALWEDNDSVKPHVQTVFPPILLANLLDIVACSSATSIDYRSFRAERLCQLERSVGGIDSGNLETHAFCELQTEVT